VNVCKSAVKCCPNNGGFVPLQDSAKPLDRGAGLSSPHDLAAATQHKV